MGWGFDCLFWNNKVKVKVTSTAEYHMHTEKSFPVVYGSLGVPDRS